MFVNDELKEQMQRNTLERLKKIEGQIRGLQGMVAEGKACEQILIQIRAVQSALTAVSTLVLKGYLIKCYRELGQKPTPEEVFHQLDQTVSLLTRFIKG